MSPLTPGSLLGSANRELEGYGRLEEEKRNFPFAHLSGLCRQQLLFLASVIVPRAAGSSFQLLFLLSEQVP